MRNGWIGSSAALAGLSSLLMLAAQASYAVTPDELVDLSLEELANLEVTSVSRRAEPLALVAASVYVITADDIRRAGAGSLPEALRLAPNLQVAAVDASQYAISARGFNSTTANKLLVLIDGRSVYTPLFSGVFWDVQDVLLDDIERIEVISGPGATVWGTNAVSGVINVITRDAGRTHGGLLHAGAGDRESNGAFRRGGALGAAADYRVYGKLLRRDPTVRADRSQVPDRRQLAQAGFRADWRDRGRHLTVQGDLYDGESEQATPGDRDVSGANLLARWESPLGERSTLRVQGYYDRTERSYPGQFDETLDQFDLELQHAWQPNDRHQLVWGAGHRHARDRVGNSASLAFLPAQRSLNWSNVFVQDEIVLHQALRATLGLRAERNIYTGTEYLPSARLAWRVSDQQLLWAVLARAVRAPSRIDRELFVPAQAPFLLAGGPDFRSEVSNTIELGHRGRAGERLSYSVAVFHNRHDRLRSLEPTPDGSLVLDNKVGGHTNGVEAWTTLQATARWRLSAGYAGLRQRLRLDPDSQDASGVRSQGNDPSHRWLLRSSLDVGVAGELDVVVRHSGPLPDPPVPSYTAVDARLAWRLRPDLQLALIGRNLFDARHAEFGNAATRSELRRALYAELIWRFD